LAVDSLYRLHYSQTACQIHKALIFSVFAALTAGIAHQKRASDTKAVQIPA